MKLPLIGRLPSWNRLIIYILPPEALWVAKFSMALWSNFALLSKAAFGEVSMSSERLYLKCQQADPVTLTGGLSTARPVAGAWVTAVATAATEQMSRALSLELAPIRVNAISPGWTDTPMWDAILREAKQDAFQEVAAKIPTGRLATAEEVASTVIFLMSNSSITGEVIHTDGGHRYV